MESELIQILRDQFAPLTLDEIFSALSRNRDSTIEPGIPTKESFSVKRRMQRHLDICVNQSIFERTWKDGEHVYSLARTFSHDNECAKGSDFQLVIVRDRGNISFASKPLRFQAVGRTYNRLLLFFCILAAGILLFVVFYLYII